MYIEELNLRRKPGIEYRKKYKCPECKEYMFKLTHDGYGECSECGYQLSDRAKIFKLMESNAYDGYYLKKEYEDAFGEDEDVEIYEEYFRLFKKPHVFHGELKKGERKNLDEIADLTSKINDDLDDAIIMYWRKYPNNRGQNIFLHNERYLFNLIEDTFFFAGQISVDLTLYEFATFLSKENKDINFLHEERYKEEFFLDNAIHHIIDSWERLINILSLLYNVSYNEEDFTVNNVNILKSKLNKVSAYHYDKNGKESKLFKLINDINSKNGFNHISDARSCNDHDISINLQKENDYFIDSNKNTEDGIWAQRQSLQKSSKSILIALREIIKIYVDKVIISDEPIIIPEIFKSYYKINFDDIILKLNSKPTTSISSIRAIKHKGKVMYESFQNETKAVFKECISEENEYDKALQLMEDIALRNNEIFNCVIYISMMRDDVGKEVLKQLYPLNNILKKLTIQYMVYSALYRTFANYDKLAKVIQRIVGINTEDGIFYFDNLSERLDEIKEYDIELAQMINDVLKTKEFDELRYYRNMLTHHIRSGALYGEDGCEICEHYIIYLIINNIIKINAIFNKLTMIN